MILPDPSDANIVADSVSMGNEVSTRKRTSSFPQKNYYTRLGLGFPSAPTNDEPRDTAISTESERSNRRHTSADVFQEVEAEDSKLLLGILRELVEETSEWDASLFMDQNFKAMIEGSAVSREKLTASRSALSSDHSQEVDLGSLGIDIFRSDGETFIPHTGSSPSANDNAGMVSFWDERGWANPENTRYVRTPLYLILGAYADVLTVAMGSVLPGNLLFLPLAFYFAFLQHHDITIPIIIHPTDYFL